VVNLFSVTRSLASHKINLETILLVFSRAKILHIVETSNFVITGNYGFIKKNQPTADTSDVSSSEILIGDPDESYITSDAALSDEGEAEIENYRFYCKICKRNFTAKSFSFHNSQIHGGGDINLAKEVCTICKGRFVREITLRKHRNQIHETNKPECPLCTYKFSSIENMERHVKFRKWLIYGSLRELFRQGVTQNVRHSNFCCISSL
jgi:transposase-like protein